MNSEKIIYQNNEAFAQQLDNADALSKYRNQFHFPKDNTGNPLLYFCGNSLGLKVIFMQSIRGCLIMNF